MKRAFFHTLGTATRLVHCTERHIRVALAVALRHKTQDEVARALETRKGAVRNATLDLYAPLVRLVAGRVGRRRCAIIVSGMLGRNGDDRRRQVLECSGADTLQHGRRPMVFVE